MTLGADYLQRRAALQNVLGELAELARASAAPSATLETIAGLGRQLSEPFLFVVAGEVKAGKSSLLNAIFGQEFCRVDVLPATDRIYLFKHGDVEHNIDINAHFAELHRPIEFLRDFNIVDTPGTNSIIAEHQQITERFVPLADLILFVFTVTNPWGASAWEFMQFIQQRWLKKVAFVVQQADLRSTEDLERIESHLRQTSLQKLGVECPVFSVSAKLALESRQSGDPEKWRASRFQALEDFINRSVAGGELRMEKLASIRRTGGVILRELQEETRNAMGVIEHDFVRLNELKTILEQRQGQSQRQIGGFLRTIEKVCDKCRLRGTEILKEKFTLFGTFKLMFDKGAWQQDFQKRIEADLQEGIQREIGKGLELIENDLKSLWQSLHESLQRGFSSENAARLGLASQFLDQRAEIVRQLDLTLLEQMSDRKIETQLRTLFSETAAWLRVPGAVAAAGGIATIVGAMFHFAAFDPTGTTAAITGGAALTGTLVALFKRGQILREYDAQMVLKRDELVMALDDQLKHAIALFYQELEATFAPLEDFCNAEKARFEPLLEKARLLETRLL